MNMGIIGGRNVGGMLGKRWARNGHRVVIEELGFEALDAGTLEQARVPEVFATLWISLAVKYGYGHDIAFDLLRRKPE